MNRHVIGLFYDSDHAQGAIEALTNAGVERGEISMISTQKAGHFELLGTTKVPEGVAAGGTIGGAIGLGATLIVAGGASGGVLAIGPLLVALAGLGFGTSVGGVLGALIGIGLPEHEARFYEDEVVERGAALVGVATLRHDDARIASILHRHKAANVTRPV